MAVEDLLDHVVHLRADAAALDVLIVQEARGRVGDRLRVVADLEQRDAADPDGDLLRVDALDFQHRLVGLSVERYCARCSAGTTIAPPPVMILNVRLGGRRARRAEAGDDQRLVGAGHLPEQLEQRGDQDDDDGRRDGGDQQGLMVRALLGRA